MGHLNYSKKFYNIDYWKKGLEAFVTQQLMSETRCQVSQILNKESVLELFDCRK